MTTLVYSDFRMAAASQTAESRKRPKILVVDDDPGVRTALRSILESEYAVTEAGTVEESLSIFDRDGQDLITLDIQMPEMDGMQGLGAFRKRSEKVPIVLISGYRTFELAQQALRLGATDYLTKPFSVQELRHAVKSALTKAYEETPAAGTPAKPEARAPMQLALQDLMDDRFISGQHRSYFLAFAQNVMSDRKRTLEMISISELIKTISLQFDALRLLRGGDYTITYPEHNFLLECDMYLLGGALANMGMACFLESRGNKSPLEIIFTQSGKTFTVVFKRRDAHLSQKTLARFANWYRQQEASLDPNTAMLVLVEKAVQLHKGEMTVNASAPNEPLLKITLPVRQSD